MTLDRLSAVYAERQGERCARQTFSRRQLVWYSALVLLVLGLSLWRWEIALLVLTAWITSLYMLVVLFKLAAVVYSLFHRPRCYPLDTSEEDLPVYTILVPLYKEPRVAETIIKHIGLLDYPTDKLDVKLLLEADDEETNTVVAALDLPACMEVIHPPAEGPRTKPKACNYGLEKARGEFVVIYDAEDRPEPDQLRKAVAMFATMPPEVACLQAKLNFFNRDQNWLTKFFTVEYTLWFDLYLPGLQRLRLPIPLGGTSNHFRAAVLHGIGGWDPFNVTEDCDLGIRLHVEGHQTRMLDSTTWEEANSRFWNWIRQRSRWVKGYFQTYLVFMRHPLRLFRELGLRGMLGFLFAVGGHSLLLVLNLVVWTVLAVYLVLLGLDVLVDAKPLWEVMTGDRWMARRSWKLLHAFGEEPLGHSILSLSLFSFSAVLFAANFVFIGLGVVACIRRKFHGLVWMALLFPLYWIMVSFGALKGLVQLFTNPHYWEKTDHGLESAHLGAGREEDGRLEVGI